MHLFVYIRKEIIGKIDKGAAEMERSHRFLPKFNFKRMEFTWVMQTEGLAWAGRPGELRFLRSQCQNAKPGIISLQLPVSPWADPAATRRRICFPGILSSRANHVTASEQNSSQGKDVENRSWPWVWISRRFFYSPEVLGWKATRKVPSRLSGALWHLLCCGGGCSWDKWTSHCETEPWGWGTGDLT